MIGLLTPPSGRFRALISAEQLHLIKLCNNFINMGENGVKRKLFQELANLYLKMEAAYDLTATEIGLSCQGCPDNCCRSFFQHHTYIEWAFLWEGIRACSDKRRKAFLERGRDYVGQTQLLLTQGKPPRILCPLNEEGLCQAYEHRLMICRMHGVPNCFVRPDGKTMRFPGCMRCQELYADLAEVPTLDRTPFYKDLASLEMAFVKSKRRTVPKVRLTLAEMLVQGPPKI
jgi:Fe-S-cluster containining protein